MKNQPKISIYTRNYSRISPDDLQDALYSVSLDKNIEIPCGSFEISLHPGRISDSRINSWDYFLGQVNLNDVVTIGFQSEHGKMVGMVDNIYKNWTLTRELGEKTVTLRGRDLGKLLTEDHIVFMPISMTANSNREYQTLITQLFGKNHPLNRKLDMFGLHHEKLGIRTFMDVDLREAVKYVLSSHVTSFHMRLPILGDVRADKILLVDDRFLRTRSGEKTFAQIAQDYEGKPSQLISMLLDPLFYEFWVESGVPRLQSTPVQNRKQPEQSESFSMSLTYRYTQTEQVDLLPKGIIRIRPRPFDDSRMNFAGIKIEPLYTWGEIHNFYDGLPYHLIDEGEIWEGGLGVNDHETITLQQLDDVYEFAHATISGSLGIKIPIIDLFQAYYHGIRPHKYTATGMIRKFKDVQQGDESVIAETFENIKLKRNRLFNWYRMNPWFESGRISIPGHDKYRVGDKIRIHGYKSKFTTSGFDAMNQDDMEFYIQEVQDTWKAGDFHVTNLDLIRGHNKFVITKFKNAEWDFKIKKNISQGAVGL